MPNSMQLFTTQSTPNIWGQIRGGVGCEKLHWVGHWGQKLTGKVLSNNLTQPNPMHYVAHFLPNQTHGSRYQQCLCSATSMQCFRILLPYYKENMWSFHKSLPSFYTKHTAYSLIRRFCVNFVRKIELNPTEPTRKCTISVKPHPTLGWPIPCTSLPRTARCDLNQLTLITRINH